MLTSSLLSISWVTVAFPPLHANSGWSSAVNRSTSWIRPERMGPTGSVSPLWNTIANRVRLSLTISSNTRSASLNPLCGRAPLALSILTIRAGRAAIAGSGLSIPVNGYTGLAGTVVVVAASVVVVAAALVVAAWVVAGASVVTGVVAAVVLAADLLSPPHALAAPTSATRLTAAMSVFDRSEYMVIPTSREVGGRDRRRKALPNRSILSNLADRIRSPPRSCWCSGLSEAAVRRSGRHRSPFIRHGEQRLAPRSLNEGALIGVAPWKQLIRWRSYAAYGVRHVVSGGFQDGLDRRSRVVAGGGRTGGVASQRGALLQEQVRPRLHRRAGKQGEEDRRLGPSHPQGGARPCHRFTTTRGNGLR